VSIVLDCRDAGTDVVLEDDIDEFELNWGSGGFNAFAALTIGGFISSENSGRR